MCEEDQKVVVVEEEEENDQNNPREEEERIRELSRGEGKSVVLASVVYTDVCIQWISPQRV